MDVTASSITATLIYKDIDYFRESWFPPSRDLATVNGASVQRSYTVGYSMSLEYSGGTKTSHNSNYMGIMLPSDRGESCLIVNDDTLAIAVSTVPLAELTLGN